MELTPKQLDFLRSLKTLNDSDNIRVKEIIKKQEEKKKIYKANQIQ